MSPHKPKKFLLNELVPFYRQLSSRHWRDGRLCGKYHVQDEAQARFLGQLLHEDNDGDYPCRVDAGDPDNVKVGDTFQLALGAIRTGLGRVVEDVDSLLRDKQVAAGTESTSWYVVSEDVASWEEDKDLNRRLRAVHRLVAAIEPIAAFFDHRKMVLVFLRDGRFDVPIRYLRKTLLEFDEDIAAKLIEELERQDGHTAQRREICATAMCELLAGVAVEERFSTMLLNLPELHQRFIDGYRLFASAFSYEKLRDQTEALRIEYSGKIHKTLADVQGQLLGIPVSTIVVATQFKEVTEMSGQFWINLAVLIGALIFCVLLVLAIVNQLHTLVVIEHEISRQETVLRNENAAIADRLKDVFDALRNRAQWHRIALCIASMVCLVGWMIGGAAFWLLSHTAF